ncbi:MAG: family permease [Candidatus Hydrogenedentes bacterium]|nr:family permease [Candidatus Hydrogenedentota bacterium]
MSGPEIQAPIALNRSIGLVGAVAIVIGGVVGVGIFILVAPAAAHAGTTLWLAIVTALVFALVSTIPVIQLASALPRAGGGYFFVSRMISPLWGALTSNWILLGGVFSMMVVATGLAEYGIAMTPWDIPSNIVAGLTVSGLYAVYLIGVSVAMWLQIAMAAQLILALSLYAFAGAWFEGMACSLDFPRGGGGFFMAVVLAYSICLGFQIISEMGEEVKDARRNIPLALLIGGLAVMVLYVTTSMVFVKSIPYDYEAYMAMRAPLRESSTHFLPPLLVGFLSLGAFSAGLGALNAGAIALPREIFAQARDAVLPVALGRVDSKRRSPMNAISAFFSVAIAIAFAGLDIGFCGCMVAVGISMAAIVVSVSSLRLPRKFPDRYAAAYVHFPMPVLVLCTIVSALSSGLFIVIIAIERPSIIAVYAVWTVAILVYYAWRVRWLARRGIDLAHNAARIEE